MQRYRAYAFAALSIILSLTGLYAASLALTPAPATMSVAMWNIEVFGPTKASNETLLIDIARIVSDYDLAIIQEIRDASNTAFPALCALLPDHTCMNSSRAGRSASKEQYGIIARQDITINEFIDYNPDPHDRWERPPIRFTAAMDDFSFTVYTIHVRPTDAYAEIRALDTLVSEQGESYVMVIGDLNADCRYYTRDRADDFTDWIWIIEEDTTLAASSCAYDRIILDHALYDHYVSHEVRRHDITRAHSDHYLVAVELVGKGS